MTIEIVIDVAGEAAGSPGVAREFVYGKIDPTPPLVTCSLDDTTGVTSFLWEFVSQPIGASAAFSDDEAEEPTFTPTVSVSGTYLIRCTVNGGTDTNTNALAFSTENRAIRKPAPGETVEFSAVRGWAIALSDMIDALDGLTVPEDAADISVDNGSWTGHLSTETTVQGALDTIDTIDYDAADVDVDNGSWTGNLSTETTVQAALDTIDGLSLNPTIYDDTTTFTDVAASSSDTQELDLGAIDDGIAEAVQLSITAGTSADTTIQLYNGDPGGGGSIIYEVPNLDLVTAALDDRNCWYADLPTTGEIWVKVTNDGGSTSSYSLRLRIKGDA